MNVDEDELPSQPSRTCSVIVWFLFAHFVFDSAIDWIFLLLFFSHFVCGCSISSAHHFECIVRAAAVPATNGVHKCYSGEFVRRSDRGTYLLPHQLRGGTLQCCGAVSVCCVHSLRCQSDFDRPINSQAERLSLSVLTTAPVLSIDLIRFRCASNSLTHNGTQHLCTRTAHTISLGWHIGISDRRWRAN